MLLSLWKSWSFPDTFPENAADRAPIHSKTRAKGESRLLVQEELGGRALFSSKATFDEVVHAAEALDGKEYRVGGNAALMSLTFARLGCNVLLGGPAGPTLRGMLADAHQKISLASEAPEDAVHLILEYAKNQRWGGSAGPRASRANRFIVVHDTFNQNIMGLEPLQKRMEELEAVPALCGLWPQSAGSVFCRNANTAY